MLKGRGKGKISNDLVAASCAAVLAVYAAGYSRTREAARRFETHVRERRPAAPTQPAAASPRPAAATEVPTPPAIASVPKRPAPSTARKPAPKPAIAAPVMTAEAVAVTGGASSPNAPREIAPVPLPAEDTAGPQPIAITRDPTPTAAKWRDGTYTGLGDSPHGDIEARVVIKDGRILEASIASCDTRYPCSVIDPLIHQPVERQSPDVDYMSHATESSDAYYSALVAALDAALERPSSEATIPQVIRSAAVMGTIVSIEVDAPDAVVGRAFEWFRLVEAHCSRFDAASELRQLTIGKRTAASPILFEAVRFAMMVAAETDGAFDPTVGGRMAARGYNRHYLTREVADVPQSDDRASFRDIEIDTDRRTILLRRPLTLDLGAVAKGLAVDAAARQLQPFRNFAIDAGGDLYLSGCNPQGKPWSAGIRHPRVPDDLVDRLCISDRAVCTSGDYERGQHILDPRRGGAASGVASATVVARSAMLADALATAAFVLGPQEGIPLLTRMGVEGLIVSADLEIYRTPGLCHA